MTDSEILDFLAEYVDSYTYLPRTETTNGIFVLDVPMVGMIKSYVSLRDAIEKANEKFQEINR